VSKKTKKKKIVNKDVVGWDTESHKIKPKHLKDESIKPPNTGKSKIPRVSDLGAPLNADTLNRWNDVKAKYGDPESTLSDKECSDTALEARERNGHLNEYLETRGREMHHEAGKGSKRRGNSKKYAENWERIFGKKKKKTKEKKK
tara:strand:- start:102 stop:536 length:435 start_codon:yes stop_codon:yes gene_type:complete